MTYKDFIGNPISEGDFCAYPGGGNAKAEYGLILYKVTGFDDTKKKIKVVRFHVDYAQGIVGFHPSHLKNAIVQKTNPNYPFSDEFDGKIAVRWVASTLENFNKLVVVKPSSKIQMIFDAVIKGDPNFQEVISIQEIGKWILGSVAIGDNPLHNL